MKNLNEKSNSLNAIYYDLQQIAMLINVLFEVLTEEDLAGNKQLKLESLALATKAKMDCMLNECE